MSLLQPLLNALRDFFQDKIASHLARIQDLGDRTLDEKVLEAIHKLSLPSSHKISFRFSPPQDPKYRAEKGRAAYDILCWGKVESVPFQVFINNKFGNLKSSARNDITTYNNLIRLYLSIQVSRLSPDKIELDKKSF